MNTLNQFAQEWWTWMTAMTWQVVLLIAIVTGLDLLIRRWIWPQVRYALWLMVLIKLVMPPTVSLNTSLVTQLRPRAQEPVVQTTPTVINEPTVSSTIVSRAPVGHADSLKAVDVAKPRRASTPPATVSPATPPIQSTTTLTSPPQRIGLCWQGWLCGFWLLGAAVLSIWLMRRLARLRRSATVANDEALPESFHLTAQQCARRVGLRHTPVVLLTENLNCPAVTGLWRPVLLMPVGFLRQLSRKDTEHMLLHEFAHLKRGDMVVHAIYLSLQILYWYNPLLWWVGRRLFHLREICRDATVAGLLKEKTMEYRRTLLEVARQTLMPSHHPGLGLLGLFEDSNRLEHRLNWLKRDTWRFSRLRWSLILLVVLGMGVFVLPMAQAQTAPVQSDQAQIVAEQQAELQAQMQQIVEQQRQLQAMMKQLEEQRAMLEAMMSQTAPALQETPVVALSSTQPTQATTIVVQAVGSAKPVEKSRLVTVKMIEDANGIKLLRSEILPLTIAPGTTLNLANAEGAINIQGVDGDHYQLMAEIVLNATTLDEVKALSKQVDITPQAKGQLLSIHASEPKEWAKNQWFSIDYTLQVPKQTHLNLIQEEGEIIVKNIEGLINLTLEDGKISIDRVTGTINITQQDGEIESTHTAGTLNVVLEDGEIFCKDLNGVCSIQLEDGEVEITNSELTDCTIRMEEGEVSCEQISGSIDISLDDGGVELAYADEVTSSCNISVALDDGEIELIAPTIMLPDGFTSYTNDGDDDDCCDDEDEDECDDDEDGGIWTSQVLRDGKSFGISLAVEDGEISVEKKSFQ